MKQCALVIRLLIIPDLSLASIYGNLTKTYKIASQVNSDSLPPELIKNLTLVISRQKRFSSPSDTTAWYIMLCKD